MRSYKPQTPYTVPIKLLIPSSSKIDGVKRKKFIDGGVFFGSFKTFGGTEITSDGLYAVEDTGTVETWYRPDIQSDCRVQILTTDAIYEIVGTPENIDMRNQFLLFRVRGFKGDA